MHDVCYRRRKYQRIYCLVLGYVVSVDDAGSKSRQEQEIFLFSETSRQAVGPAKLKLSKVLPRTGHEGPEGE